MPASSITPASSSRYFWPRWRSSTVDDEVPVPCPPDSSSVESSEEVVDPGLADDELDADDVDFDDSSDADEDADDPGPDVVDDDSSAQASPGAEAMAPPTPSAIANAPTRPMYLEYAVGLERAERDPREVAVGRIAAGGPFRRLRPGNHPAAASDCADRCSRAAASKKVPVFGHRWPHDPPLGQVAITAIAEFAVTIASNRCNTKH